MRLVPPCVFILLWGCAQSPSSNYDEELIQNERAGILLPIVEDNVYHDTLLIHNTYELNDNSFIMVAGNNDETFEGLRLYHYRLNEDGSPEIIHYSSPAYDSWMMLPSFFEHPDGGYLILAEFGSTQSWGQKVMLFSDSGFVDLGFLDVAVNEIRHIPEIDSTFIAKASIAPYTEIDYSQGTLSIHFTCDSVFVYDDLRGHLDTSYLSSDLEYKLMDTELKLVVD